MSHKQPQSLLPDDVVERTISDYKKTDKGICTCNTECIVNDQVVAKRCYGDDDQLWDEQPLDEEGRKHGVVLQWHENGQLSLAEPYHHGIIHGTARQWSDNGTYLGSYTLKMGTGFDIWRELQEDGTVTVAEVATWRNGIPSEFTWWFDHKQRLWWERHFAPPDGLHGIERAWNEHGRLCRDAPQYWIQWKRVTKRQYIAAAAKDPTLPPFRVEDQTPDREFPEEVQRALDGERDTGGDGR